ncbi:F0F1 ATP synthase subunit A [Nitrosophilus alvini]|uniref:F0F1 ATP synthase subunit A n=1 Tax=Nitrosophilus alvini TaxID=2714855 RepID=UPI00190D06C4|nr:F0F1 ATP synthase subunit A [Nitrosophilus alvini]
MNESIASVELFKIQIGSVSIPVTESVVTAWGVIVFIAIVSFLLTRKLRVLNPSKIQIAVEGVVEAIYGALKSASPINAWDLVPLIGTMWIYIGMLNLIGIIPYLHNPTKDLSTTAALATVAFLSIHYYGIKYSGLKNYLKKYTEPVFILLPLNIFGDISRIFAMAIRLFGNMLSWELIIAILLLLAGFLVPVPMMLLSIVGDVIQAYLFGMLTFIFILGGIKAETKNIKENENG